MDRSIIKIYVLKPRRHIGRTDSSSTDSNLGVNRLHPGPFTAEDRNGMRELANFSLALFDSFGDGSASAEAVLPGGYSGESIFDSDTFRQKAGRVEDVVGQEGEVGEGDRVTNHPFTGLKVLLQDTENTEDFIPVSLDSGGNLLGVQVDEPMGLAIIRSLAASLEEKPLHDLRLLFGSLAQESVRILGIVLRSQIEEDSIALPDGEVVVVVVNKSGNTSVGIIINMGGLLLLALIEVQEMGLVLEAKLLHDEAEFEDVGHVHANVVEQGHRLR